MSTRRNTSPNPPAEAGRRPSRRSKDPRGPGNIDGSANWASLRNPQPGFRYIWASEGSRDTGAEYYYSLGYDEVICPDDPGKGVQPGGRRSGEPGKPHRDRGHVLMSIPEDQWDEIQENGEDGKTGRAHTRALEKRIQESRSDRNEDARLKAGHMFSRPLEGDD